MKALLLNDDELLKTLNQLFKGVLVKFERDNLVCEDYVYAIDYTGVEFCKPRA